MTAIQVLAAAACYAFIAALALRVQADNAKCVRELAEANKEIQRLRELVIEQAVEINGKY